MNLYNAINAHVAWKVRLRHYLEGISEEVLDPEQVGRDDNCELGRWIYANMASHANKPLFKQVQAQHADFHRCAAEIVSTIDNGKHDTADELLNQKYAQLSRLIVKSLTQLDRELHEDSA